MPRLIEDGSFLGGFGQLIFETRVGDDGGVEFASGKVTTWKGEELGLGGKPWAIRFEKRS